MEEQHNTINKGGLFLVILFLIIIFTIVNIPAKSTGEEQEVSVAESFSFSHSSFEKAVLEAEVAYIENLETGETVYQKNAGEVRPLASLTKIMTTYSALSLFPENATITISAEDLKADGDFGLIPGEVWKLEDLIVFMLVSSSNDAALAISREALKYTDGISFPEYMTKQAGELGLATLQFQNVTGLDLDEEGTLPGAMGTAKDITKLFSMSYKKYKDIFDQTKQEKITFRSDEKQHTAENTNIALHSMPGVIGSKTGYTNTAGGNLSVITDIDGVAHVVTVLDSTRAGRFEDVQEIIGLTQEEYHDESQSY